MQEIHTEVAIIGAGTAGLYAMREVKRAEKSFIMIDHGPLGTTCARVGCMPSKAALHAASLWQAREHHAEYGITGSDALCLDTAQTWAAVRALRDYFAGSTASSTREITGKQFMDGHARFIAPQTLEITLSDGELLCVKAGSIILATGSSPVLPPAFAALGEYALTTDELFELETLPLSLAVIGLGAVGLEMGLALARLGVGVTGVELAAVPAALTDPAIAKRASERFGRELPMWFGASATAELVPGGVRVRSGAREVMVEKVLVALGRRPNLADLNLASANLILNAKGMPEFDAATMQIGSNRVFIAGDLNGDRALMHEAADEGAIAGYNASRAESTRFRRRTPLSVAFTAPDIASVGARLDQLDANSILIGTAEGASNGRSLILHSQESLLHVYADAKSGLLLGASIFALDGEHLSHLLAWAIQRGETAHTLLQMPFYHPVVEELLQSALQSIVSKLPAKSDLPLGLQMEDAV